MKIISITIDFSHALNFTEIITALKVIRKSTVGAGDSMVAGIVFFFPTAKDCGKQLNLE